METFYYQNWFRNKVALTRTKYFLKSNNLKWSPFRHLSDQGGTSLGTPMLNFRVKNDSENGKAWRITNWSWLNGLQLVNCCESGQMTMFVI